MSIQGWIQMDAKLPDAQAHLERLFLRYFPLGHLSFYIHRPAFYQMEKNEVQFHFLPSREIGFCEIKDSKTSLINILMVDFNSDDDMRHVVRRLNEIGTKNFVLQLWLQKEIYRELEKKSYLRDFTSKLNWHRDDGHFILDIDKPRNLNMYSKRLSRGYSFNEQWIDSKTWTPANELDMADYLMKMKKILFSRGVSIPSLTQLKEELARNSNSIQYWLAEVRGRYKSKSIYCGITVATVSTENFRSAEFLHYVDNREEHSKATLSPGTVCQEFIIENLQKMGHTTYNLGTYGPQVPRLSEFKAQFGPGYFRPYSIYRKELGI